MNLSRVRETTTTHTRYFTYYLCGACDERRRKQLIQAIVTVVGLLMTAFVGLLVYAAIFGESPSEETASEGAELSDSNLNVAATNLSLPTELIEPSPLQSVASTDVETQTAVEQLWPEITQGIEREIATAMDSGAPAAWKWHDMRGDVIVGGASETSKGPCRTFYLRLFTAQQTYQSAESVRCRSTADHRWIAN